MRKVIRKVHLCLKSTIPLAIKTKYPEILIGSLHKVSF